MRIVVRLFAFQAEHAGGGRHGLEVAEGMTVAGAVGRVREVFTGLPWPAGTLVAVNQEYARPERVLREGDELAVIPPVSGG